MPYNAGTQLAAIEGAFKTAGDPLPLDKIRARRDKRKLQELEQFKANTERGKAAEYVAAGRDKRKRDAAADKLNAETLAWQKKNVPKVTVPVGHPDYMPQWNAQQQALSNSPYSVHQEVWKERASQTENMMKGMPNDPNTSYGAGQASENQRKADQSAIAREKNQIDRTKNQQDLYKHQNPKLGIPRTYMKGGDARTAQDNSPEAIRLMSEGYNLADENTAAAGLTAGQSGKLQTDYMAAYENHTFLSSEIDRVIELAQTPGAMRGAVGMAANIAEAFADQVSQVQNMVTIADGNKVNEAYLNPDPEKLTGITRAALLNGQMEPNIVTLSFMLALVNNPDGRISDQDVKSAKQMISGDGGSIAKLIASLEEVKGISERRMNAKQATYEKFDQSERTGSQSQIPLDQMTSEQKEEELARLKAEHNNAR